MKEQKNDPLGEAILDYFNGIHEAEIIVHCSISEDDVIPVAHLFRTIENLSELEKTAVENCRGKILDIGAGAGSHTLILQDSGADVSAIDISGGAVSVMKKRGVKSARKINLFDLHNEKYDTLLMLMNGIGIAGNIDGLNSFLEFAKTLLNDYGQLIVDSSDIQYMFSEEDGSLWIDLNARYYGEVNYQMEYKNKKGSNFDWLYIDFSTLKEHASENGFDAELLFEDEENFLARLSIKAELNSAQNSGTSN